MNLKLVAAGAIGVAGIAAIPIPLYAARRHRENESKRTGDILSRYISILDIRNEGEYTELQKMYDLARWVFTFERTYGKNGNDPMPTMESALQRVFADDVAGYELGLMKAHRDGYIEQEHSSTPGRFGEILRTVISQGVKKKNPFGLLWKQAKKKFEGGEKPESDEWGSLIRHIQGTDGRRLLDELEKI